MNSFISCKAITLEIGGKQLLKDISFSIAAEENLVVFGPNGAGKSLLLTILSGNLEPTQGTVTFFGKSLYSQDSHAVKKKIGFVSPHLFSDYDFSTPVIEVVMSGLFGSIGIAADPIKNNAQAVRTYIKRVIKEKYPDDTIALALLEKVHSVQIKDTIFGELSYGEKVRVLIARSLINTPSVIILDEPTTGLDLKMRAEFYRIVNELAKTAKIIYVTHYLEEILPSFTQILLLKNGSIFSYGRKQDILTEKNISTLLDVNVHIHEKNGTYLASF